MKRNLRKQTIQAINLEGTPMVLYRDGVTPVYRYWLDRIATITA
jgi:hypothetical protein